MIKTLNLTTRLIGLFAASLMILDCIAFIAAGKEAAVIWIPVSSLFILACASFTINKLTCPLIDLVRHAEEIVMSGDDLSKRVPVKTDCHSVAQHSVNDSTGDGRGGSVDKTGEEPCETTVSGQNKSCRGCEELNYAVYNETDRLSLLFNTVLDKTQNQIKTFSTQIRELSLLCEAIPKMYEGMAGSMAVVQDKAMITNMVAQSVNENMQKMSNSTTGSTRNVQSIANATENLNQSIAEISSNTEKSRRITSKAVESVDNAREDIHTLGIHATAINKVMDIIVDIADRTKLLGLNATLEAVRAGQAGKGFAVVAAEIKDLAHQVNEAADEVRDKIEAIQKSTGKTAKEIQTITGEINGVNEIVSTIAAAVSEQSATTEQLAQNIANATSELNEISEFGSQLKEGTAMIVTETTEVQSNCDEMNASNSELQASLARMNELAANLRISLNSSEQLVKKIASAADLNVTSGSEIKKKDETADLQHSLERVKVMTAGMNNIIDGL